MLSIPNSLQNIKISSFFSIDILFNLQSFSTLISAPTFSTLSLSHLVFHCIQFQPIYNSKPNISLPRRVSMFKTQPHEKKKKNLHERKYQLILYNSCVRFFVYLLAYNIFIMITTLRFDTLNILTQDRYM